MSWLRLGLLTFLLTLSPLVVQAHPLSFTETTLTLNVDGTFQVDLICDLDALALGVPQDADDAALSATLNGLSAPELSSLTERLRQLFLRRVRVRFDGNPEPFDVTFPDYGTSRATESAIPTVLGLTARLSGTVPTGSLEVEFFASRSFSDVHLTIIDQTRDVSVQSILERGAISDPFQLTADSALTPSRAGTWQYFRLGFVHILPEGTDHILFVLGIFFLSLRIRILIWQVTAFTVSHAVTLALGAAEVVALPPQFVEPLISLSIVWIAVENIRTPQLSRWRTTVVFLFGLVHGLGFASALNELGLPNNDRLFAILTFNAGIEAGQLMILGLALATVGWFKSRTWYRHRVAIPASVVIGVIGLVWTVEQVFY